jgi:hypothetical protein
MSSPVNSIITGTFASTGVAHNLTLPSGYTEIELTNVSNLGSAAANTNVMKAWGSSDMPAGAGIFAAKTNGAATIQIPTHVAANGFTFVSDSASTALGAANATITAISQASPAAVSLTSTAGLAGSDVIRVYSTTGMLQIAGMDFTIDTVVANTSFNLSYIDTSGFAAAATAGTLRRVPFDPRFYPRRRFITGITAATSAVITLSVTHGFTAGQAVRIKVPDGWGMTEIDGLIGNITAVNTTTNTITVDIDSSAFTTFAFPTSATAAAGTEMPQVIPVGETANATYANNLDDASDNQAFTGVIIGTSMQTTGVTYQWVARRGTAI